MTTTTWQERQAQQQAAQAFSRSQTSLTPVGVQVGDGITYGVGSDRYPATVQEVSPSGKTIYFTDDEFKAGEGHDYYGEQVWEYTSRPVVEGTDPMGSETTNLKSARWDAKIQGYKFFGRIMGSGRHAYQDPSF